MNLDDKYNYMRSKRKQVNKYNLKGAQQPKDTNNYDYLRRTSGTKPFHLAKLRQAQRLSIDLAHAKNQIMHRRSGSNQLYDDQKQAINGLVIKQKPIVDTNQKIQGQKKEPFLEQSIINNNFSSKDIQNQQNGSIILEQSPLKQESQLYNHQDNTETPEASKVIDQYQSIQTKHSQLHLFKSPIYSIVTQKHDPAINAKENILQSNQQDQRSKLQIKLMKQKALPPFSFTSTKWRSKSQILQIDKWKEKYGKHPNDQKINNANKAASLSKFDYEKEINKKIDEVKTYIHSLQNQKASLPNLHRSKQLQSKSKIYKFWGNKKEDIFKIETNPESQSQSHHAYQQRYKRSSQGHKKKKKQEKIEIAIKKMYSDEKIQDLLPQQEDHQKKENKQELLGVQEKDSKVKKKKLKFPQIQITTFFSTKEEQNEKKRLRLENIHKMAKQWRYHPPKKVYLQKMMEEIPQRWEYTESRESNRGAEQVDHYLKFKEEQAKRDQFERELQVNRLQLQLQKIK